MLNDKNFKRRCRSARSPFDLLLEGDNMKYMLLIYQDEQLWGGREAAKHQEQDTNTKT
jgi:hypothetical protein